MDIDFQTKVFVNGLIAEIKHGEKTGRMVLNTGNWSPRFRELPMVRQADDEGWAADLRAAVTYTVRKLLYAGHPLPAPEDVLPTDAKWIEAQRTRAERFAKAKEWRDSVMAPGERYDDYARRQRPGTRRGTTFKPASAPAFHAMQEASRNRHLHVDSKAELERIKRGGLTETSKRIAGETE